MAQYIIIAAIILFLAVCFGVGWYLGSRSKEKDIRLKSLEDINTHYEKMSDNFNKVDDMVDHAKSLLKSGMLSKKFSSKRILKAKGNSNSKKS